MSRVFGMRQIESNPFRCLLVEDDDDHALLLTGALSACREDVSVERVHDGVVALARLRQSLAVKMIPLPQLVILDIRLPHMDGHALLREIKSDPILRTIPVVVLSTSAAEVDRARAYGHHANSYLVKPMDPSGFDRLAEALIQYWCGWNLSVAREGDGVGVSFGYGHKGGHDDDRPTEYDPVD